VPTFSIRSLKINELVCSLCPYCEKDKAVKNVEMMKVKVKVLAVRTQISTQVFGSANT